MVYGAFPPGTVPNGGLPIERRLSWVLRIMPYTLCMHCCGMSTEVGWDKPWDADENRSFAVTPVFPLHCPASPGQSPHGYQSATHYIDPADKKDLHSTPFIGLAGVGKDSPFLSRQSPRAGVFGYERGTKPEDIKDGTSTTTMVAETAALGGAGTAGGPPTVRGVDPNRRPYIGVGHQFGGNHPGGAMVLLADGSVRFVREAIEPKVFEALATIAGGESLPEGWDR
jgi:prepilin-type processing-associated H-X9-DG protein